MAKKQAEKPQSEREGLVPLEELKEQDPALVPKDKRAVVPMRYNGVQFRDFEGLWRFAKAISTTDFVPKGFKNKPGDVMAAIEMGLEVGLPPMQALQNIAVINGRPSIWGDAALGLVRGAGALEFIREEFDGDWGDDSFRAVCVVLRKGEQDAVQRSFSIGEAKDAKLWDKDSPWKTYPRRMLQMRARSWALRDVFPDILKGLWVREEAQDIIDIPAEVTELTPTNGREPVLKDFKPEKVEKPPEDPPPAEEKKEAEAPAEAAQKPPDEPDELWDSEEIAEAVRDPEGAAKKREEKAKQGAPHTG